jgi:hypothetical protein
VRVFENRVLKKKFGPKSAKVIGNRRDCIVRSFMICTLHKILFG